MKDYQPEDTVTFINIDDEPLDCKFDGRMYRIDAGDSRVFRVYVAQHFAKHLADKILQKEYDKESIRLKDPSKKNRSRLWIDPRRAELYSKMIPEFAEGLEGIAHSARELEVKLDERDKKNPPTLQK